MRCTIARPTPVPSNSSPCSRWKTPNSLPAYFMSKPTPLSRTKKTSSSAPRSHPTSTRGSGARALYVRTGIGEAFELFVGGFELRSRALELAGDAPPQPDRHEHAEAERQREARRPQRIGAPDRRVDRGARDADRDAPRAARRAAESGVDLLALQRARQAPSSLRPADQLDERIRHRLADELVVQARASDDIQARIEHGGDRLG